MRSKSSVLKEISIFKPVDENWLHLDDLLAELWAVGIESDDIPVLFSIFERFPENDGCGVFWSIVHGIESTGFDYGKELKSSIEKVPSEMGLIMWKRKAKG